MKRIGIILMLTTIAHIGVSQCNPFFNIQNNTSWEMQMFNARDKPQGKQINKVKEWITNDNGWKANIQSTVYDKKDKELQDVTFDVECVDGKIMIDLSKYMPQETMQAFKDMDMTIEGENLMVPEKLDIGQELADGSITLSGNLPFTMTISIEDRKVEGKETITVPAGTYEVYKITYTTKAKTMMTMETKGIEYIAEGVGVVKTETLDKKGNIQSYSVLTDYTGI